MVVKQVGVPSCARLVAAIYAVFGLLAGIVLFLAAVAGFDVAADSPPEAAGFLRPLFGAGAILALPVFYAVLGYLGGLSGAWVFNNASRAMGGLELDVE